jgi:hypothetical protein
LKSPLWSANSPTSSEVYASAGNRQHGAKSIYALEMLGRRSLSDTTQCETTGIHDKVRVAIPDRARYNQRGPTRRCRNRVHLRISFYGKT